MDLTRLSQSQQVGKAQSTGLAEPAAVSGHSSGGSSPVLGHHYSRLCSTPLPYSSPSPCKVDRAGVGIPSRWGKAR